MKFTIFLPNTLLSVAGYYFVWQHNLPLFFITFLAQLVLHVAKEASK